MSSAGKAKRIRRVIQLTRCRITEPCVRSLIVSYPSLLPSSLEAAISPDPNRAVAVEANQAGDEFCPLSSGLANQQLASILLCDVLLH
jgi:hypothetical protein